MTNFATDHGTKLLELLEHALNEIDSPERSLKELVSSDSGSIGHYLELQRMRAALRTYLDTDANLRYVALVGSFSSGKTATINNLIEIAGTDQARTEDTNPADDKLTLCAHESKEQSLLATLVKSTWEADRFFHRVTLPTRSRRIANIARRFKPIPRLTSAVAKKTLAPSGKSVALLCASCLITEGRLRNRHERWVQDAMDAGVLQGERQAGGRRNRVVLASRR